VRLRAILAAPVVGVPPSAVTFVVTHTNDPETGSLRPAILDALNANTRRQMAVLITETFALV
jgi:hypothetical protein